MSEFKVGDRVRIKDYAAPEGWLRPGGVGRITSVEGDYLYFRHPTNVDAEVGCYYTWEVEADDPRAYLAGPMRGIPEFNFPAFLDAQEVLKLVDIEVFNPAQHDIDNGFDYKGLTGNEDLSELGFNLRKALGADMDFIAREATGVIVLPGWENSSGARAEVALAKALKIPVVTLAQALRHGSIEWAVREEGEEEEPVVEYEWKTRSNHAPGPAMDMYGNHLTSGPLLSHQTGEVRSVSSTGGEKGTKVERFDLLPAEALATVARHYGVGAAKYEAHNWRRGYEWSKSYAALQRHANAFWSGEDIDEETGSPHMAAVAFHALTLLTFLEEQPGFDDRYKKESTPA